MDEEASVSSKRSLSKTDANQPINTARRQSLLRSPSSRHAILKFPAVGKPSSSLARASIAAIEQGMLSPPMTPQVASQTKKTRTLRGALGAIMPDLYFASQSRSMDASNNGASVQPRSSIAGVGERMANDELSPVEEDSHQLHLRIQYDDHRNDLLVHVIEGERMNVDERAILSICISSSVFAIRS